MMLGLKNKYYSLDQIDKINSQYKMIIGERSNGKTYSILKKMIDIYLDHGGKSAYVRRWELDIKKARCERLFSGLIENEYIKKASKGRFNSVYYRTGTFWLCNNESGSNELDEQPFCACFAISQGEHDKGGTFSQDVELVCFDEFCTRYQYLPDEFILWTNVLSTIVRTQSKSVVYMLANTVSKTCLYFNEMGLNHVKDMKQGEIEVYTYGNSDLKVAVEYVKPMEKSSKPSDVYFAFDNPRLNMIKNGAWEIAIYPHLPEKYRMNEIVMMFFIKFDGELLQCDIVRKPATSFIYIHQKTSEIQNEDRDIIYTTEYDARPNWFRNIYTTTYPFQKKIARLMKMEKLYFQTNEIGEVFRGYVNWCRTYEKVI